MKLQVISIDGKKTNKIELSDKVFSLKPNKNIIQSIIDWQINRFKPRAQLQKYMHKKVPAEQDTRVGKLQYLLVVVLLMVQRDRFIKLKN